MRRGDAFMPADDNGLHEHLHIVLTDPSPSGEVITVNVTTRRERSEVTVCLQPGDHPFINRESVCAYRFARIRSTTRIDQALAAGYARSKPSASATLLARLEAGLLRSPFCPPAVLRFYRSNAKS